MNRFQNLLSISTCATTWAREQSCTVNVWTCCAAAQAGQLDVLMYLRAHQCPWDETTIGAAAQEGHLDVVRWARQHGCPWDVRTCGAAAARGHLKVLMWERENHCPWDAATCSSPPRVVTCPCCSGCGRITARGTRGRAKWLARRGTWTF
jgi:hypothetical protein